MFAFDRCLEQIINRRELSCTLQLSVPITFKLPTTEDELDDLGRDEQVPRIYSASLGCSQLLTDTNVSKENHARPEAPCIIGFARPLLR
uniref:Uncharacterized protein n=1 Tax=Ascaris lumbricoides TaxID=6252 RepID=A0A0M3IAI3_ASCLU